MLATFFLLASADSTPAQTARSQEDTIPSPSALGSRAWSTLEADRFVIYHEGRATLAESVLRFLDGQPPLPALPTDIPRGVSVFLAPDEEAFRELTGSRVPEWSAGVALPGSGVLVLPVYASERTRGGERERVLRHEWAHLGLHEYLQGRRIPRWFDEGYAEWASGWDSSEAWILRVLLATGRTPPLDSLTLGWPRDAASARAAYLLAATALEYLIRESGERGLELLLERRRGGDSFEVSLRTTYGVTLDQLETHWKRYVRSRYGWLLLFSHSAVLWGVVGGMLVLLFRLRRRRDRERMARLRAAELPERPAWWRQDG